MGRREGDAEVPRRVGGERISSSLLPRAKQRRMCLPARVPPVLRSRDVGGQAMRKFHDELARQTDGGQVAKAAAG